MPGGCLKRLLKGIVINMQFHRYSDVETLKADIFDALLENETQNNLLLSIITDSKTIRATDALMATLTDQGRVVLAAFWAKPFNLLLYAPENSPEDCMEQFAHEILKFGIDMPGVLAERSLARRFVKSYCAGSGSRLHQSMTIMRLDRLAEYKKAPGFCRVLGESDMFFVPFWERAFSEDCRVQVFSIPENIKRVRSRLGKNTHFLWEDGAPVSQAVHGRDTPNGAVINWVYTPPHLRGRGYATSVVAELSKSLLDSGKRFCCLFADSENMTSRKIYQNLGYYDVCTFDEIHFQKI